MSPSPYTEDTLVQQITAEYLEERLGWESVYAHNHEDFGPDSLLGRTSDREVVLTRPLRAKLVALNPGRPEAAYDEAVRHITAVAANREKHALMRDGVQVRFRNDRGDLVHERRRVPDFDDPAWEVGIPAFTSMPPPALSTSGPPPPRCCSGRARCAPPRSARRCRGA